MVRRTSYGNKEYSLTVLFLSVFISYNFHMLKHQMKQSQFTDWLGISYFWDNW